MNVIKEESNFDQNNDFINEKLLDEFYDIQL